MNASGQDKFGETSFWDMIASQRVYAAFDDQEYEEIFSWAMGDRLDDLRIIDIGSASGVSAALLASRGAKVIGVDISPELIKQSKTLWKDYSERIDFMVGDAENLEIEDASVDFCFFGGVLHHFPIRDKVYKEAFRILKPGGKFVAIEPNFLDFLERIEWVIAGWRGKLSPNEDPIDPKIMSEELSDAGFGNIEFITTRHDVPFLAQLPILRNFFSRQKGFVIKKPLLTLVNALRPPTSRGTFFVIQGQRK